MLTFPESCLINRIIESEGVGRIIWFNLSQQKHGLDKLSQNLVEINFKIIQGWGIHNFLGRLFQWLISLIVKNAPLVSNWNLCWSNFYPIPLVFSMELIEKDLHLLCSHLLNSGT